MVDNEKDRIVNILHERKLAMAKSPLLVARYESMLLEAFPLERKHSEHFFVNTFTGSDEVDYLSCRNIFDGKQWNEVDLSILYSKYVQFLILNNEGMLYYLPTFLKFFFDLRHLELEFFTYVMSGLEDGFVKPNPQRSRDTLDKLGLQGTNNYASFETLSPAQSKLVAFFLANIANLLPSEWYESQQAQRALTNYWGSFLLF